VVSYSRVYSPGSDIELFCLPHVPHAPPMSFNFIWSPELFLLRRTEHKAPRYVVFSTPLLPRPSYTQYVPSTLFSNIVNLLSSLSDRNTFPYRLTFQGKPYSHRPHILTVRQQLTQELRWFCLWSTSFRCIRRTIVF
jgi:hypothetical protein